MTNTWSQVNPKNVYAVNCSKTGWVFTKQAGVLQATCRIDARVCAVVPHALGVQLDSQVQSWT